MKPSVLFFRSDRPKKLSKREDKKNVNIKWNSRLYFQLGLIVSLLIVFLVMESTIGLSGTSVAKRAGITITEPPLPIFVMERPEPIIVPAKTPEVKKPVIKKKNINNVVEVPNTTETPIVETPVTSVDQPVIKHPVEVIPTKTNNTPRNIINVEFVPVFPGCEGMKTNDEKRACMSSKISSFIARKFDVDKFSYMDSGKKLRIAVQFKIDSRGDVTEIIARGPDNALEKEATRVMNRLPKMLPGRQGNVPVDVLYTIPITFTTY